MARWSTRRSRFLTGESDEVKRRLHELMDEASLKQDYERAASFRDRLTALSHVQSHQGINPQTREGGRCVRRASGRGPDLRSRCSSSAPATIGATAPISRAPTRASPVEEVLESFVAQFYDDKPPPKLVLLSHEIAGRRLLAEALSLRAGHKIRVERAAARREARARVEHALVNAREALARRLAEVLLASRDLCRLAELFDLDETPERVEVLRQQPHFRHQSGRRHDRGRAGRLHQRSISEVQHEDRGPCPRGRLRHDAGDADTALQQACAGQGSSPNGWAAPDLVLIDGGPGQLVCCVKRARRARPSRDQARGDRQGARPQCRARAHLSEGPRAVAARAARSRALLHPDAP